MFYWIIVDIFYLLLLHLVAGNLLEMTTFLPQLVQTIRLVFPFKKCELF